MYKSHDPNSPDYDTVKVTNSHVEPEPPTLNPQPPTPICSTLSPEPTTLQVTDFGLANWNFSRKGTMRTACGTPNYIAPEVILVDEGVERTTYGTAVDLWSLGVAFYVMLCGFAPFTHENTAALFNMICKGDYTFPSPYWAGISDRAKNLVSMMLQVDPDSRYTAAQCLKHPWIQDGHLNSSGENLHSSHRAFMLIRKLPIFDRVDPQCLQEVTRRLKVVRAEPGECVIQAGDYGDCMYFLSEGAVQVLYAGREIDRLFPGDFFGEIALTVSEKRVADVYALGLLKDGSRKELKEVSLCPVDGTNTCLSVCLSARLPAYLCACLSLCTDACGGACAESA